MATGKVVELATYEDEIPTEPEPLLTDSSKNDVHGTTGRCPGSSRPRTVRMTDNIAAVHQCRTWSAVL